MCTAAGVDATPWAAEPVLEIIAHVEAILQERDQAAAASFAIMANRAIIDVELEAASRVEPYPGVAEMLQRLMDAGYRVGIVTRNSREAVDRMLSRWSVPCEVLLTRDDVLRVKPDPGHLEAALAAMGIQDRAVMMCGDHPMDVAAGRAIGAVTVAVRSSEIGDADLEDAHPDLLLERITDLMSHLDGPYVAQYEPRAEHSRSEDVGRRG
jgi:phosphoglycolate phosphatase